MSRIGWIGLVAIISSVAAAPARDDEWGKGITYTTKWDDAIKQARATGKMLLIYNGWERSGI